MYLNTQFDVVLMLTWSNWDSEPRSNRYHYATRFAKEVPTLFIQHNYSKRKGIGVRPSGINNLEIIDISVQMTEGDIDEIKQLLRYRGFLKPLIWIYDPVHYSNLMSAFPHGYLVFHATEDYFTKTEYWNTSISGAVGSQLGALLKKIDYVVFVTTALKKVYKEVGGYAGPGSIIKNGCDVNFFISMQKNFENSRHSRPSAIFQGGINGRLDYKLLFELISLMPDWDFKFCGAAQISESWKDIIRLPNVQYFGALHPEEVGKHMHSSTVGIIPFKQDSWIINSLPLKAYEYVACGLPVVTVPILELEVEKEIFAFAKSANEFEVKMRLLERSRHEVRLANMRRKSALENSYDKRFELLKKNLLLSCGKKRDDSLQRKSRVAVLYDPDSLHVSTIKEYLESFERYSRNEIVYIPATLKYWAQSKNRITSFNNFDAVILHYSIRLSVKWHLDSKIYSALKLYHGLKLAFIQDEYEGTEIARAWLEEIYFDVVYTCIPKDSIEKVYPKYRFPSTEFIQVLTGYTSVNEKIEQYAKPLKDRVIDIAYRGRNLPPIYGSLGHEKYRIGLDVKKISMSHGLNVDIELDSEKRIYGDAWYEFLGSARSTLGTESGSNIFDMNGSIGLAIKTLRCNNPSASFEQIYQEILINHEGFIRMNQISPKLFEAIQLRTALILFEGDYSDILLPNVHYIPLKKDYSNIDEVFRKLHDSSQIEKMTSLAYEDIITSGRYSYREFIGRVDSDIASRLLHYVDKSKIFLAEFSMTLDKKMRLQTPLLPIGISYMPQVNNVPILSNLNLSHYFFGFQNPLKIFFKFPVRLILRGRSSNSFIFASAKKVWPYLPNRLQHLIITHVIN
jgi:hypothetical protein